MGIKHKLSTVFYPKSNGQTERANQTLKAYLRHYLNYAQDNWVTLLPIAQLAINNNVSETTKETPFFSNFGKDPNIFATPLPNPNAARQLHNSNDLAQMHNTLRGNIQQSNDKIMASRHKTNKDGPQLKKGDKVYLLTKNLKTKRSSKKLDHIKVGPFLVDEQRGPLNYRLKLPTDAKVHPVFYISLLEPADPVLRCRRHFTSSPKKMIPSKWKGLRSLTAKSTLSNGWTTTSQKILGNNWRIYSRVLS